MTQRTLCEHKKNAAQLIKLKNVTTATSGIWVFELCMKYREHVFTKVSFLFVGRQEVESKISNVLKFKDCVFDILEMFKWQIQPAFTCSKLPKKMH